MAASARDQISPVVAIASAGAGGIVSTFPVQPAAGAKCIVFVAAHHATGPVTVTDNGTPPNAYVQDAASASNSSSADALIFRADNIALPGAGNLAVTIKATVLTHALVGFAVTYTAVSLGPPTALAVTTGVVPNICNSGPVMLDNPGIYCAVMTNDGSSVSNNITTTAPFTTRGVEQDGSNFENFVGSDQVAVIGSLTADWDFTVSGSNWNAAIVAYGPTPIGGVSAIVAYG
jgi:hypothetical protein